MVTVQVPCDEARSLRWRVHVRYTRLRDPRALLHHLLYCQRIQKNIQGKERVLQSK